jgi:ribonuclease HI
MKLTLYTDGGSRGNPGPAATGIVIQDEHGSTVAAYGEFLGNQTNNYAEYKAIISALKKAKQLGATEVICLADSKLVIEQLNGNWKVKEPTIRLLFFEAMTALRAIPRHALRHIPREQNTEADAQVNTALDAQNQNH